MSMDDGLRLLSFLAEKPNIVPRLKIGAIAAATRLLIEFVLFILFGVSCVMFRIGTGGVESMRCRVVGGATVKPEKLAFVH